MIAEEREVVRAAIDARRRGLALSGRTTCLVNRRRKPYTGWSKGCTCDVCADYARRFPLVYVKVLA